MALEDKVNEILGLESKTPPKEEFKAPVPRKEEKDKTVTIRKLGSDKQETIKKDDFIKNMLD